MCKQWVHYFNHNVIYMCTCVHVEALFGNFKRIYYVNCWLLNTHTQLPGRVYSNISFALVFLLLWLSVNILLVFLHLIYMYTYACTYTHVHMYIYIYNNIYIHILTCTCIECSYYKMHYVLNNIYVIWEKNYQNFWYSWMFCICALFSNCYVVFLYSY